MDNFKMDWEYGSATDGNIAVMGEINLSGKVILNPNGESAHIDFTLGIGIGEGHHTAAQKTMSALTTPFDDLQCLFPA